MACLSDGDLAAGWPQYDWRLRCKKFALPHFSEPLWDGSPLGLRVLLVHAEQGLGDTLHFIRYLPLVEARAAQLVVQVQPPLLPLLSQSGFANLVPRGEPLPGFDVQSPLMSLPGIFRTTLETAPAKIPYLAAGAENVEAWRRRLREWPGLRIGIAWQGNPQFEFDRWRLDSFGRVRAAGPGARGKAFQFAKIRRYRAIGCRLR